MTAPKPMTPAFPHHLLTELLNLRPYIEHILCDGSREAHVRAATQDHVQTVLRKAVQHLPFYRPHEEGLRPWVRQIALNVRADVYRSAQPCDETFGLLAADRARDPNPSPERQAQARVFLEKVLVEIEKMPDDMKAVLTLAAIHNDSHAEIAAQLEITEDAAKMRLSRARKELRKRAGTIRDHVGAFFLVVLRKLGASRVPLLNRLRQMGHVLPPVVLWFVALPQLERAAPMPTENVVVAPPRDEPSPYVRDEPHTIDAAVANPPVVEGAARVSAPKRRLSTHVPADKPRQRTQSRRDFDVDVQHRPTDVSPRE